jgi:hypothetical protein
MEGEEGNDEGAGGGGGPTSRLTSRHLQLLAPCSLELGDIWSLELGADLGALRHQAGGGAPNPQWGVSLIAHLAFS